MKFLIIDDSATMRRIVANTLQRIGHTNVVEATDGADGLVRFDATIDFIITDWNMPNMSGLEFAKALRARDDGRTVPVLMVTTRSSREDIMSAVQAGVNNYILKPFTAPVLKEKIDELVAAAAAAA